MDDSSDSIRFRDVVIVGGGCYGTFYAGQLERARARGRAAYRRLLIVDRDPACQVARELGGDDSRQLVTQEWGDFFDDYLGGARCRLRRMRRPTPSCPLPSCRTSCTSGWSAAPARRWPGRLIETRPVPAGAGHALRRERAGWHPLRLLRRLDLPHPLHRAGHLPGDPGAPHLGDGRCHGGPGPPDLARPTPLLVRSSSSASTGCSGSGCSM